VSNRTFYRQSGPRLTLLLEPRFIVDRERIIQQTKKLPARIRSTSAYLAGTLKAYTSEYVDNPPLGGVPLLDVDDLKIMTHLLSAYRPGSDDFITIRHCLYMLKPLGTHGHEDGPCDAHFLFVLHSSENRQQRYQIPQVLETRVLPAMPYLLDSVLVMPAKPAFVPADRHRLTATLTDFFAAIDHIPAKMWNEFQLPESINPEVQRPMIFASTPQPEETLCRGYVNLCWQYTPRSALACAKAVSLG
jgi:hypothetical protein